MLSERRESVLEECFSNTREHSEIILRAVSPTSDRGSERESSLDPLGKEVVCASGFLLDISGVNSLRLFDKVETKSTTLHKHPHLL